MRVDQIGARNFISLASHDIKKILSSTNLIWLCTSSKNQMECLRILEDHPQTKVLIEKPIGSNISINSQIFQRLSDSTNLFISEPWIYSKIWLHLRSKLSEKQEIKSIEIKHFGPNRRQYMYPPQDWLHHDISIVHNLNSIYSTKTKSIEIYASKNNDVLEIKWQTDYQIKIKGGYAPKKLSSLKIRFENGEFMNINLNKNYIKIFRNKNREISELYFDDNPVLKMVEEVQRVDSNLMNKVKQISLLQCLQILEL